MADLGWGTARNGRIRVWDPFVRVFHWSVVAAVILNQAVLDPGKTAHRYVGYAVAGLLALRLVWGFAGTRHARFRDFAAPPGRVLRHLAAALRGRDPRYVGHNPAGGAMMLALMALLAAICLTGWMQKLDMFWGVIWVEDLHAILADLLVWMALLHAAAAVLESFRHRENLIWSMVDGRKRAERPGEAGHAGPAG
ncbi:cytochrome b/b6 domain-containing protein [Mangrovicoccus sp. HB161399]|uniref:cytochrome b/b6 domain-containing protein n=1 Tax=Mangrovicoccus sp. HB161399 TaxID=2720392 RepID=UPI00155251A0|nr:cytochrome b/b6 domain-containing protein [Mangrovicoccus sp. HB161399]